jgi:DNA-binding transcriptional MerR regulator
VNDKMTIQSFSERTGLPSSTLRYYEKEGLIIPVVRGDNSYRLYEKEQIPVAITIHSLRQAGISLADIRQYLQCNEVEKVTWISKWRKEIDSKLASLNVARKYLYGIEPEDEFVRLIKWDTPVRMVWFRHRVKRERHPFSKVIEERASNLLKQLGIVCNDAFVLQEQIEGDEMIGKVGFRINEKTSIPAEWLRASELEVIEPTLFVTLDCLINDDFACFSLMMLLQSFGFDPAGATMEHYQLNDHINYQLMIPVLHGSSSI